MLQTRSVLSTLLVLSLVCDHVSADYTAVPRWGQAVALVNDVLFVHGGRTDPYNEYSYTSAPVDNDLLFLSLSSSFDPSSPPWQYVGGSSNSSAPQGPAVAWHTLSAFDSNDLLLFGGVPGPNSQTVQVDQADSAYLLNVYNRLEPSWTSESNSWASEPTRRIYLSACSSGGKVYIIGGEKADGSGSAFSDHYVFDPSGPSFTQLPTSNGPPDLYGHASVVLSNGTLLVLGGYSPSGSSLVPFNRIWALDTTRSDAEWYSFSVSASNLPSPRRGFAAVKLDGDRVLIHGGGDATLQTTYSDGWILDTSQNPASWSSLSQLSQLGPRKDHFAIAMGSEVVFGFGFGSNGPAPAALQVYDISYSAWQASYTPIPTYTASTLPPATQTGTAGGGSPTGSTYPPGQSPTGTGTRSGYPGQPTQSGSGGGGDGQTQDGQDSSSSRTLPIVLGTLFGALGLLAAGAVAAYYVRRHRQQTGDAFHLIGGDGGDDEESAHLEGGRILPARMVDSTAGASAGWLAGGKKALVRFGRSTGLVAHSAERRDMLADEDTRDFGRISLYNWGRQPSSTSTATFQSGWAERPKLGGLFQGSWASLRSLGGAMFDAAGARAGSSREASGSSKATTAWYEKDQLLYEPFSETSLMRAGDPVPTRPRASRQPSTTSVWSYTSYHDPFEDGGSEGHHDVASDEGQDEKEESTLLSRPPNLSLQTVVPKRFAAGHSLSPVTEVTSRTSMSNSLSSHSQEGAVASPYTTLGRSSLSSQEYTPRSPPPRTISMIDAHPRPSEPLRRSDSWWARFAKTSFLDRRHSDPSKSSRAPLEFRDPQPPPRLVTIEESPQSVSKSPESPESLKNRRGHNLTYSSQHARSMSSLQTAKTADSEALERMAATVDVVQRIGSHVTSPSGTTSESQVSPVTETTRSTPPFSSAPSTSARATMGHDRESSSESWRESWRHSGGWSIPSRSLSLSARAVTSHMGGGTSSNMSSPPLSGSAKATLGHGHSSEAATSPPLSTSARATLSHATESDHLPSLRRSSSVMAAAGHTPARTPESPFDDRFAYSPPVLSPPVSTAAATIGHSAPTVLSPEEMTPEFEKSLPETPSTDSSGSTARSSGRRLSGPLVSSRVQELERRNSQDAESSTSPPPRNTRKREERPRGRHVTVNYGLVQRPSLFVANPDDRQSSQGSSSDA